MVLRQNRYKLCVLCNAASAEGEAASLTCTAAGGVLWNSLRKTTETALWETNTHRISFIKPSAKKHDCYILQTINISVWIPFLNAGNTSTTPCFTVLCVGAGLSWHRFRPIREHVVKAKQETRWPQPISAGESWRIRKFPSDCHLVSKGKTEIFL